MTVTYGSDTHPVKAKSGRKPKSRVIRLLTRRSRGQECMVEILERGPRSEKSTLYWLCVIPSDWGFAVRWTKFFAQGGEVYHTNIGGPGGTVMTSPEGETIVDEGPACCDCKGFEAHGHCKHISATTALVRAGKI